MSRAVPAWSLIISSLIFAGCGDAVTAWKIATGEKAVEVRVPEGSAVEVIPQAPSPVAAVPANTSQPDAGSVSALPVQPAPNSSPVSPAIPAPGIVPTPVAPTALPGTSTPVASPPISAPPISIPPTSSPPASKVSLSSGVALAQTLPDGTAMGFSVDYQFSGARGGSAAKYAWVILPGRGQPVPLGVTLEESGTLQTFVPSLRPENGPFRCFIAEALPDGKFQPISATVALR